jgi:hypothetical protein
MHLVYLILLKDDMPELRLIYQSLILVYLTFVLSAGHIKYGVKSLALNIISTKNIYFLDSFDRKIQFSIN